MLFCGFERESHAPGDHLVPDQGCARPQGTSFAVAPARRGRLPASIRQLLLRTGGPSALDPH